MKKVDLNLLKSVLKVADVFRYIEMFACPDDEYDSEAEMVYENLLDKNITPEIILYECKCVLEQTCEEDITEDKVLYLKHLLNELILE